MTPAQVLGAEALRLFVWGVPWGLAYLAWAQRRRHRPSALALLAAAFLIAALAVTTGGTVLHASGALLAASGLVTFAALSWKLALRRRAGFREGETIAERLLPLLIVADILLLLMTWPALAEWRAGLVGG